MGPETRQNIQNHGPLDLLLLSRPNLLRFSPPFKRVPLSWGPHLNLQGRFYIEALVSYEAVVKSK